MFRLWSVFAFFGVVVAAMLAMASALRPLPRPFLNVFVIGASVAIIAVIGGCIGASPRQEIAIQEVMDEKGITKWEAWREIKPQEEERKRQEEEFENAVRQVMEEHNIDEYISRTIVDIQRALAQWKSTYKMHVAAGSGNLETVRRLLDTGEHIEGRESERGLTPLHIAAKKDAHGVVGYLLARGANVEALSDLTETPLHMAAQHNAKQSAVVLIDNAANMEARDRYGATPLVLAAQYGMSDMVVALIDRGANMEARAGAYLNNGTPLNVAIDELVVRNRGGSRRRPPHIADVTIDELVTGSRIKQQPTEGIRKAIVELAKRGANIHDVNSKGETPIAKLLSMGEYETADELQKINRQARNIPQENPKTTFASAKTEAGKVFEAIWRSIVVIKAGNSQGSGVAIKPNLIATNCHVTGRGDQRDCRFQRGKSSGRQGETAHSEVNCRRPEAGCLHFVSGGFVGDSS